MKAGMPVLRVSRQQGAATIEFALMTIVLVSLMALGVEYARLLQQYDTLTKGARAAARYAATQAPGTNVSLAKCLAVNGNTACSGSALVPGLTSSNVAVTTGTLDTTTATVSVTISGLAYTPVFTSLGISVTFKPISATMPQPK